jgi:hypothetical protein
MEIYENRSPQVLINNVTKILFPSIYIVKVL